MIQCAFEDGGKADLRHITVNALVIKDDTILLGKRGTYNGKPLLEAGKYGLIGGFFNRDETLEEAVRREVLEETGWEISNIKLFRINDRPDRPHEDRQNVDVIFTADAISQTGKPDEETAHLVWYPLNQLPDRDTVAFDHFDSIELYVKFRKGQIERPIQTT